jgi:DNA-binding NtrC family response regulator
MVAAVGQELKRSHPPILVVDDDPDVRKFFERLVGGLPPLELLQAEDLAGARRCLDDSNVSVAFIDKCLPDGDGVEFCRELLGRFENLPVYVITGTGSTSDALSAIEDGVTDYIPKPFSVQTIRDKIRRHLPVSKEDEAVGKSMGGATIDRETHVHLIGNSSEMIEVGVLVQRLAKMDIPVVLQGGSGVGKEVVARKIHELSARAAQKFIGVNCGAIPKDLIESELFGHEKGAFTDAKGQRVGLFEEANGGTIFLDEISETTLDFQVKLLRVLQEGKVRRVGANREIDLDVRVLAASNRKLTEEIAEGRFREDLYFRLKGSEIYLPSLKDRRKDIMPLAEHFGNKVAQRMGRVVSFSKGVVDALEEHLWPGNVRELERVIERAVQSCNGTVLMSDLPSDLRVAVGDMAPQRSPLVTRLKDVIPLWELTDRYAGDVLALCEDNKAVASKILRVDRKWWYRWSERQASADESGDSVAEALPLEASSVGCSNGESDR